MSHGNSACIVLLAGCDMHKVTEIHLHCEDGCEKADFIAAPVGHSAEIRLVCIRCGADAINVPDCHCLQKTVDTSESC